MKWIYLPILFALAFFYTKMSFTDFLSSNKIVVREGRKPASLEMPARLQSSRPRISSEEIYKNIEANGSKTFSSVAPFKGTLVGNVHVENFGFVIDDSKHVRYQIMDFAETSRGKLYQDILAHLMFAKALDKRVGWIEYFEAYKRGLKGYAHVNSYYVDKGIGESLANATAFLERNVTKDYPIAFTELKKSHDVLSIHEQTMVESVLKKVFPKIEIFDFLSGREEKKAFHVLARVRPLDKVQWLVLKKDSPSAHDDFFGTQLAPAIKMEKIKGDVYGKRLDNSLTSMKIDNENYIVFYKEAFSSKLNLDDIPYEDYHDIILDQARVLGEIHARSLGELTDDYIKAWAKISAANVDEHAIELKYRFKD